MNSGLTRLLKSLIIILSLFFFPLICSAGCWNDSECRNYEICECPSSSNTGNCDSIGKCVSDGRNWNALKKGLNLSQTKIQGMEKDIATIKVTEGDAPDVRACKKYREKCKFSNECCGNMFCFGSGPNLGEYYCREVGGN